MGQMGFFDLGNRYSGLDAKNEPLLKIDGVVPWEDLRARLEAVWRRADKARKSRAGRKPWDAIVMFKTRSFLWTQNWLNRSLSRTTKLSDQIREKPVAVHAISGVNAV